MTVPLYNLTDTWNDGGTVFTGLKLNVTDTASAVGSMFVDFQRNSFSFFNLTKNTDDGVDINIPVLSNLVCTQFDFRPDGNSRMGIDGFGFHFSSSVGIVFESTPTINTREFYLQRDGAVRTLALTDFSNGACTFRVYNIYTDSSNYERGVFDWTTSANVLTIDVQVLGSGTQRVISLNHLDDATGAGTATFAATNCPASTLTTPYTWIKVTSSDGSIVYMPAWK